MVGVPVSGIVGASKMGRGRVGTLLVVVLPVDPARPTG
jgi:hypothetical protein